MKRYLVLNLISLTVTALLLVLIVLAWYVSNTQVSASGIVARTEDGNFTLELERGTYDETNPKKWTWTSTKSLSITNMQPNDAFFFRFKITTKTSGSLKVKLSGVASDASNQITLSGTDVLIGGTKNYNLVNNTVSITEYGNNTPKTLYTYNSTDEKFSLVDYKVEDAFYFYDYGIGTENFYNSDNTYYTNDVSECDNDAQYLTNVSDTTYPDLSEGISYGYFALEFNDIESIRNYLHIDGFYKSDSNLFQAQTLVIANVSVEELRV